MKNGTRSKKGATLGLVVTCTLILSLLVVGLFQLQMILGGSEELRNAVDAGGLNVGKQSVTLKTTPQAGAEQEFADCVDSTGQIGLTNINRVLGKAMLVNANVQAMQSAGQSSGTAGDDAKQVADAAQSICDRIAKQLNDASKTQPFFNDYIQRNTVRMSGKNAAVAASSDSWDIAYTDKDKESNLRVDPSQFPSGVTLSPTDTQAVQEKGNPNPSQFIKGYHSINYNSRNFNLVPFRYAEKPHLISGLVFATSKQAPPTDAVPNAFACKGNTVNADHWTNTAMAYAVANPQRQYQLAIPHAFVRIKLDDNKVSWYANSAPINSTTYQYLPGQTQVGIISFPVGTGTMTATAVLGNEYIPPTLFQAINALSPHPEVSKAITQRIREIKSDFSEGDLQALLMAQPVLPGVSEYFIFPVYTSADATSPTILVAPSTMAAAQSSWLKSSAQADGSQTTIATENRPAYTAPSTVNVVMTGTGAKPLPSWTSETGTLSWTAGSGYGQCLGTLEIQRTTSIYANGACTLL